jgi:hypothetical protein
VQRPPDPEAARVDLERRRPPQEPHRRVEEEYEDRHAEEAAPDRAESL